MRGFSIIEVLVAIVVLVVGVMGVFGLFTFVVGSSRDARLLHQGTLLAEQTISKLEHESSLWVAGQAPPMSTSLNALYLSSQGTFTAPLSEQLNFFGAPSSQLATIEASQFCAQIQLLHRDLSMISGAVRIYWSKDPTHSCLDVSASDFELATTAPRGYGFVTLPFAVRAQR